MDENRTQVVYKKHPRESFYPAVGGDIKKIFENSLLGVNLVQGRCFFGKKETMALTVPEWLIFPKKRRNWAKGASFGLFSGEKV